MIALIFVTLAACGPNSAADDRAPVTPAYGPTREMIGVWSMYTEHSGFVARSSWSTCNLDSAGCWLEATEAFWREFERKVAPDPLLREAPYNGSFLVKLKGRLATNGPFGHLGEHRCQIQAHELISAERQHLG